MGPAGVVLFVATLAEGAAIRESFDGERRPPGWKVDLAPDSRCAIGLRDALAIYFEPGRRWEEILENNMLHALQGYHKLLQAHLEQKEGESSDDE